MVKGITLYDTHPQITLDPLSILHLSQPSVYWICHLCLLQVTPILCLPLPLSSPPRLGSIFCYVDELASAPLSQAGCAHVSPRTTRG